MAINVSCTEEKEEWTRNRAGTSILIPTILWTSFLPFSVMCLQKFWVCNKQDVPRWFLSLSLALRLSKEYERFLTGRDGGELENSSDTRRTD